MQIFRRIGLVLVWFAGALFVFAAVNKNDPYLISLRGWGNIALGRHEHRRRTYPHPPLLLEARRCGKGARSAVVPAATVDARRRCCVRMAQAARPAG